MRIFVLYICGNMLAYIHTYLTRSVHRKVMISFERCLPKDFLPLRKKFRVEYRYDK